MIRFGWNRDFLRRVPTSFTQRFRHELSRKSSRRALPRAQAGNWTCGKQATCLHFSDSVQWRISNDPNLGICDANK